MIKQAKTAASLSILTVETIVKTLFTNMPTADSITYYYHSINHPPALVIYTLQSASSNIYPHGASEFVSSINITSYTKPSTPVPFSWALTFPSKVGDGSINSDDASCRV